MFKNLYRDAKLYYNEDTKEYTSIDDGVDWQWGDRYIGATEVSDEAKNLGGKYYRNNNDGTITEYVPHEMIFAFFVKRNEKYIRKIDKDNFTIVCKNKKAAISVFKEIYHGNLWFYRGLKNINLDKKNIQMIFDKEIYSRTYTPAENPVMRKEDILDPKSFS